MAETSRTTTILIWVIAIACGVIGFFLAEEVMAIIFALIVGIVVCAIVYWILTRIFGDDEEASEPAPQAQAAAAAAPEPEAAPEVAEVEETPVAETVAEPAVEASPDVSAEPVSEPPLEPESEPAPEPTPEPEVAEEAASETSPEILDGPKGGHADDLKKIKGVGPGLEKTLNELGIFHFDQIAAWGPSDIEWVDARLKFKGRITRDDWVSQAKEFAK